MHDDTSYKNMKFRRSSSDRSAHLLRWPIPQSGPECRWSYFQGGITAAYAYGNTYKVEAVMAITPLKRVTSEDKNRQSKQNPSRTFANTFFSKVLDEACEQEREKNIRIYTSGYTKEALPYHNFVNMHEYC